MSTLSFQPEADRYYAEGYWRPGDLWGDFAAIADDRPDKVALVLGDRRINYGALRRAAVGLSARLDAAPGDVVVLLGRHSIEAAVALLGCLHRGVVLAPLPPMFNETQISALVAQTHAKAIVCFGGEKEIARCEGLAHDVIALRPADVEEARREQRARRSRAARRRRPRAGHALVGHHVDAEGDRALEQHAALRHRGCLPAVGDRRRGRLAGRLGVRICRWVRVRLLPRAAQGRDRRADEPLGAR